MKTLFIPVKLNSKINKERILGFSKKLPKYLAIAYSIQYSSQAKGIKQLLSKEHIITNFIQVLGCSQLKLPKPTQAVLLISDGKFHAISLAYTTKLPVYIYNKSKLEKISEKDIRNFEKSKKASYVKFLNAEKVGILISTKKGQQNFDKALKLRKNLVDKDSYLFVCNNVNINEFENFSDIQSWVNTACPRLDMNSPKIVNFFELKFSQ